MQNIKYMFSTLYDTNGILSPPSGDILERIEFEFHAWT